MSKLLRLNISSLVNSSESACITRRLAAAIVTALALVAGPARAAGTFYVDVDNPNASDTGPGTEAIPYRTMTAADRLRGGPGTTLLVKPGVYRQQVTLEGEGNVDERYVIRALGPGVIVDGSQDFGHEAMWVPGPGTSWLAGEVRWMPMQVFVDGQRLAATTDDPAVMAPGTFHYVFFEGLYVNLGGANPGSHALDVGFRQHAFRLNGRSFVTIQGFTIRKTDDHGIYSFNGSSNLIVRGNHVTFAHAHGIAIQGGTSTVVDSNVVSDSGDHGINLLSGVTNSIVQDNESFRNARGFERAANGLMLFGSSNNLIQRNRFHDNEDSGVDFDNGASNNISLQNLSWNNGDHGFDHQDAPGTQHVGDVSYGNQSDGFSVEGGSTGVSLYDCIAVNNGLTSGRFDMFVDTSSTAGFQSDYNVLWNSTTAKPVKYNGVQFATVAAFNGATGFDFNSIQADPRFVDPAAGNFHLMSGSLAIDSGNSSVANWPLLDGEGNPRLDDGVAPNSGVGPIAYADRGAFEFNRSGSVAVADHATPRVALGPAYPNPGRGPVSFALELPRAGRVEWTVTDALGRAVGKEAGELGAGRTVVRWSGRSVRGTRVPAGIYMVRVSANGETLARRFAVVN